MEITAACCAHVASERTFCYLYTMVYRDCNYITDALAVMIGSSSPLAYCTVFIIMSSEVVDLHICIYICTSHCLYMCTHRLRDAATLQ